MKIPFKPSLMKIRRTRTRYLIIHHTSELYENPSIKVDNASYKMDVLYKGVMELKQADINYNFVIEQVKSDWQVFMCRPYVYKCDWDDIPNNINNSAIHIALLGNYDFKIPPKRMYEVLGYKCISPLMKSFRLSENRIKLHNEVSTNKELSCPGEFIDKEIIISMARRYLKK